MGSHGRRWLIFSCRPVAAMASSMKTVVTPAPTAASVKATSTASSTTQSAAMTRL